MWNVCKGRTRRGVARGSFHSVAYLVAVAICKAHGCESSRGQQEEEEQAHESGPNGQGSLQGRSQLGSPGGLPFLRPAWLLLHSPNFHPMLTIHA